jgi:hypothetical protein
MLGVKVETESATLRSSLAQALATFPLQMVLPPRRPPPPPPALPHPQIPLRNHRDAALRMAVGAHRAAEHTALGKNDDLLEIVSEN